MVTGDVEGLDSYPEHVAINRVARPHRNSPGVPASSSGEIHMSVMRVATAIEWRQAITSGRPASQENLLQRGTARRLVMLYSNEARTATVHPERLHRGFAICAFEDPTLPL